MVKIWELEEKVKNAIEYFENMYVGEKIQLLNLINFGFNAIWENDYCLGYDFGDFNEEQLQSEVYVIGLNKDVDGYTIVEISFE